MNTLRADNAEQMEQARKSHEELRKLFEDMQDLPTEAQLTFQGHMSVEIPREIVKEIAVMFGYLAAGKAVSIVPNEHELTSQEVANILNVSRPHVVKLLDDGQIPFHMVGTHRRVKFSDAQAYREQKRIKSRDLLRRMSEEAQDMELI